MHLAELRDHLLPVWKLSRQKDVKTAVGYLAQALDCPDPQHCPLELYNQPLATLYQRIEAFQRAHGKSRNTIRNTKNTISKLFRLAEAQQLISRVPLVLTSRYQARRKPPRPGSHVNASFHHGTSLPYAQWPPDLQEAFTTFQTWATAPVVPGRPAQLRKRLITVEVGYRKSFEGYFGYLHHIAHISPAFDVLFDLPLVTAYVHWHINECHHRVTRHIHDFLKHILALTRQYRPDEQLRAKFLALEKTLPIAQPVYDKKDAWISTAELSQIGRALWPQIQPHELAKYQHHRRKHLQHPGIDFARWAAFSLMFQLWTFRPYRSRNMREMRLGDNLYRDAEHHWRIKFQGEQLKVARKGGKENVFDLSFPASLVPVLEDYLNIWRPIFLARADNPDTHVFLTQFGTPYTEITLSRTAAYLIYRYTGKHWHPHIIRTVWATECIRETGDFYTAAYMLNDRLETVIAKYTHLRGEGVAEKADRLIEERNGRGK